MASSSRAGSPGAHAQRFESEAGWPVLLERSHALPLVEVHLLLRTGSAHDPFGMEGLTRLLARLLRMGPRGLAAAALEDRIARLGARLSVETSPRSLRFRAIVLRRNLEPFFALLSRLLREPAFRPADLAYAKRETLSELLSIRDDDGALSSRWFRRELFADHLYSRSIMGSRASVRSIRRQDLLDHWQARFVSSNLLLAVAGDVDRPTLEGIVERHLMNLPGGVAPSMRIPPPRQRKGLRVVIVDKPERTQAQLVIGTLGVRAADPRAYGLSVSNAAFGGSFSSRLVQAVRVERGWSYGAQSRLDHDRQRSAWSMWTLPNLENAAACAALQLELVEEWVSQGLRPGELRQAKGYLVNGHCFAIDTASKRLEARLDAELLGLPEGYWDRFPRELRAVTREAADRAVLERISPRDQVVSLVAPAREVEAALSALPGLRSLR
ncbi:MAG: insulinase family protein, partial [Myxococcales bacterium]|nr:insulinase family protein [Myxococcales bacterium]